MVEDGRAEHCGIDEPSELIAEWLAATLDAQARACCHEGDLYA